MPKHEIPGLGEVEFDDQLPWNTVAYTLQNTVSINYETMQPKFDLAEWGFRIGAAALKIPGVKEINVPYLQQLKPEQGNEVFALVGKYYPMARFLVSFLGLGLGHIILTQKPPSTQSPSSAPEYSTGVIPKPTILPESS